MDIIRYYLWPKSTTLKICCQKYNKVIVKKWEHMNKIKIYLKSILGVTVFIVFVTGWEGWYH